MKILGLLRYVFTAPVDFVSVLVVLFIRAAWGSRMWRERGCLIVELAPRSWPMRTWYKGWAGTTFAHVIMLAPLPPEERAHVLDHELIHVEQVEAQALIALMYSIPLAITWHPAAGLVAWWISPWLSYLAGGIVALLRGGSFYASNLNEVSALAIAGR